MVCENDWERSGVLQEQLSTVQTKLDEEESKNIKLQQHINKLEHHSAQMQEVSLCVTRCWLLLGHLVKPAVLLHGITE